MKLSTSRRNFLRQSTMASIGFLGLQLFVAASLQSCGETYTPTKENLLKTKYGRLRRAKGGALHLPKGFSYRIIARMGDPMSDGLVHPDKPDGMATYVGSNGRVILVRNHELMPTNFSAFGRNYEHLEKIDQSKIYDFRNGNLPCSGGTTTLIVNEATLEVEQSWLSLTGTLRNCAGGATPWGTWISCEEIVIPAKNGYEQAHGYNFEVPITEQMQLAEPVPLKAMGQFNHEAVCVDPKTSIVYQTEDREDGLIYRFLPNEPGKLVKGGILQALAIKGKKSAITRNWKTDGQNFPINEPMEVEWINLKNVEEIENDTLRMQGFQNGAAKFARGEGMWFGNQELYFACTSGGVTKTGQIFRYTPSPYEGTSDEVKQPGQIELFLEPNNGELLKYCDNLTVAPWGDVIFCEDHARPRVVGITKNGQFYKIAENIGFDSEFAGGVFSPSGKTYFVNIQHAGLTLAIQGPWKSHGTKKQT